MTWALQYRKEHLELSPYASLMCQVAGISYLDDHRFGIWTISFSSSITRPDGKINGLMSPTISIDVVGYSPQLRSGWIGSIRQRPYASHSVGAHDEFRRGLSVGHRSGTR
jgi:hypothetical protein